MTRTRYGLALASAATLASLSCGPLVGAAFADPGGVPHEGNNGKHLGQVKHGDKPEKDKDKKDKGDKTKDDKSKDKGKGHANGHAHAPGQQSSGSTGAAHGDPPGNNGTVKIAAPSDAVGHPSNNPHPGCSVVVEWFGFDAGDDVVSTVSFAPHAPTSDVTIAGTSPSSVFVGGDAASGGTDLDGRQAYTLTFDGEPHPKQGYHVKLTVATPYSHGNDTKTKVFWVEPCAATPAEAPSTTDSTTAPSGDTKDAGDEAASPEAGVLGTVATAPESAPESAEAAPAADRAAAVPTAIDAGESNEVLPDWARSPIALAAAAGGLVLVAAAVARRARNGA